MFYLKHQMCSSSKQAIASFGFVCNFVRYNLILLLENEKNVAEEKTQSSEVGSNIFSLNQDPYLLSHFEHSNYCFVCLC